MDMDDASLEGTIRHLYEQLTAAERNAWLRMGEVLLELRQVSPVAEPPDTERAPATAPDTGGPPQRPSGVPEPDSTLEGHVPQRTMAAGHDLTGLLTALLGEHGLDFHPAQEVPPAAIPRDEAITAARQGSWNSIMAHYPLAELSAALGTLTTINPDSRSAPNEIGELFQERLVWIVTLSGAEFYTAGVRGAVDPISSSVSHMVVDAYSAEPLIEFR